jgi:hypothetical protein
MLKKLAIALAAAVTIGVATPANAQGVYFGFGDPYWGGPGYAWGGPTYYRWGPPAYGYAYAPRYRYYRHYRPYWGW